MSIEEAGILYIVATPIGNLGDISARAVEVLSKVDLIAAEDTRHSGRLLQHLAINRPMWSLHEHNERKVSQAVVERLLGGDSIALISDAGTPLISDPGYPLTRLAHQAGIRVVPIPGASALIAALSVSGLATDRFIFEGFLPAKTSGRQKRLAPLVDEPRTLVFYESPHRIVESLQDMVACFGPGREALIARELTKTFETLRLAPLGELLAWVQGDENQRRGEFVVAVAGAPPREQQGLDPEAERVASLLAEELPLKQAAALAAKISGEKKNALYQFLLARREGEAR